jgi:hypothetical protein
LPGHIPPRCEITRLRELFRIRANLSHHAPGGSQADPRHRGPQCDRTVVRTHTVLNTLLKFADLVLSKPQFIEKLAEQEAMMFADMPLQCQPKLRKFLATAGSTCFRAVDRRSRRDRGQTCQEAKRWIGVPTGPIIPPIVYCFSL